MSREGGQFLHEQNPNLHKSPEVELTADYLRAGGQRIPNEPASKLEAHISFLSDPEYVNDGILTGDPQSVERQIEAHVVREENVPEGYFRALAQQLHEQGHGDIEALLAQITPEMRAAEVEARQADQRASLQKWVEYLGGEDGGYPDWFKYYVWTSVTKLGVYNKEKQEFSKRSIGTMASYPDLNREALAYVYDKLQKARIEGEAQDDQQLQVLLEKANFGQLYIHAVSETAPTSPELLNTTEGSWRKYNQSTDPRAARRLAESLQGHGTGWCTAGESTAEQQLSNGDFYVYYTRDEEGKDTIPRVAIRMQNGQVAEVRGINAAQELEPEFADIASEQLQGLSGGDTYIQKADDMKRLTRIAKLLDSNPQQSLEADDIRFLYELDHDIQGFGYERDPRIDAIRQNRAEVDRPEIAKLMPEIIRDQLQASSTAYREVARQLGLEAHDESIIAQIFAEKEASWQESGLYDYLVEQLIENGSRYTLVAIPDAPVGALNIVELVSNFGEQQPYSSFIDDALYSSGTTAGKYTDELMAGAGEGQPIKLRLVPSRYTKELGSKPVEDQLRIMQAMQQEDPKLNLQVPSHLEAVSYWYTLRAQGDKLVGAGTFEKTLIRHIDVPPITLDGWSDVPYSCVDDAGKPYLNRSGAEYGDHARLSVG